MTLRPTGMVVFATLESTEGAPVHTRPVPSRGAMLSESSSTVSRTVSPALTHTLLRRASRSVAWLLGR
jgi:hypothetical protein